MHDSPAILILDPDAERIAAALRSDAQTPLELRLAADVEQGRRVLRADGAGVEAGSGGIEVVLARPDLFAALAAADSDAVAGVRWVQSTWAGVGPLLGVMAQRPELCVTGVKGIFGPLIREYVLGWLLALEQRLPEYLAQQRAAQWRPLGSGRVAGRRMALLGLGSIGRELALGCAGLGIDVVGISRGGRRAASTDPESVRVRTVLAQEFGAEELLQAVAGADYLVSVVPETPTTRGLIDARVLAALAPGAVVINVGRGSVLDETALLAAVAQGAVRAAVLDVFETEPLPAGHPFWHTPGVFVTPHVAATTRAADIARVFRDNLVRRVRGETLVGVVDIARGY